MYTLYYSPGTASLAVHWMLIHLGTPFSLNRVDLRTNAQKSPEYLAINPGGHVPALLVDGKLHAECAALLMLLAERHPEAGDAIPAPAALHQPHAQPGIAAGSACPGRTHRLDHASGSRMTSESKTHGNRAMTRPMHRLALAASLGLAALAGHGVAEAQTAPSAATGRMVQPRLIIHVVPDLEKSVAFYTEGVGYDVIAPPAELKASTLVHKAVATTATAKARAATLHIPGSNLQLQLIQFSGIEGKPFTQHHYDPGVTRFSVQVRDVYQAFNRVKDRGVTIDSTSAGPVFTQRPNGNTQAVMLRDPDGFVLEFVEAGVMPQTDVPASSNVYNARASLTLDKLETSAVFYRDLLGFEISPANKANDAVLALQGTPRASVLLARSMPPGSNIMWVLWEFSDIEKTRRAPSVQDPGASAISVQVENLPALLKRMQAAGITIETPGGAPIALGDGHKGALVRSPDGLLIELVE